MRKYFLLLLFSLPIAFAYGQQLIVIPEDTDTLKNNHTVVAPVLEDFMYIDSLGNQAVHMVEWRKACQDYRFQKEMTEEVLEKSKGGKVSGSIMFALGFPSKGSAAGLCVNIKRAGNPWGFMARADLLVLSDTDENVFFQTGEEGPIYTDRELRDNGAVFGVGVSKKYKHFTPFVMYNFGSMSRRVEWVDFSVQDESYSISGIQLGMIVDIGRINLMGSYTSAGSYLNLGLGFEIH